MPSSRNNRGMNAREALTATLIAFLAFVIVLVTILVSLVTGFYSTLFDGLDSFLDWKHAGAATMVFAVIGLIVGARLWRWLSSR